MEANHSQIAEIQAFQTQLFTASQSQALLHSAGEIRYAEATPEIRDE